MEEEEEEGDEEEVEEEEEEEDEEEEKEEETDEEVEMKREEMNVENVSQLSTCTAIRPITDAVHALCFHFRHVTHNARSASSQIFFNRAVGLAELRQPCEYVV